MAYSFSTSAIDLLSNRSDSDNIQDFVSDLVVRSLILAQGMQSVTALIDPDMARICRVSRRKWSGIKEQISLSGLLSFGDVVELSDVGFDSSGQFSPPDHGRKTPSTTPDAVRMREARMRRKNANEHPNERTNKTANDPNAILNKANEHPNDPNERGSSSCAPVHDAGVHAGAEIDNQNKNILGLYTESESDSSYTDDIPNQILGDFLQKPPCESSPVAEPEILEPEIIPPDLSDIRSAVSGMLVGVVAPMSDTPAESATGGSANAENPSRSATPVPACGTGSGPVKPRRSPGISRRATTDFPQFEFDQFWDACPRKVGKAAAMKAYVAARKLASLKTLLEAMKSYARSRAGEDPQYTCHPATWLNQGRWDDEIPPDPMPGGGGAGHSVMRPGKRASFDPVDDAFQAEMAEIAERERENHVH